MKFKPGDIVTDGATTFDFSVYAYIVSNDLSSYRIAWKLNNEEYVEGYPIVSEDIYNKLLTNIFEEN